MLSLDLNKFGEAAGWDRLPPDVIAANFSETAASLVFPGALLPAVTESGRIFWYAAASDASTWRQLRPLLVAYAGPTITAFTGVPHRLNPGREPERLLQEAGVFAVAALVPPEEGVSLASRALTRLQIALDRKPVSLRPPPLSTASMLMHFDMCLAEGDRAGAEKWLANLRSEWRLDVLNLHFAEVRLLNAFRDWETLAKREWLPALCQVRKPLPVARALMEAIWQTNLASFVDDETKLKRQYRDHVRSLVLPLLGEVSADIGSIPAQLHKLESSDLIQLQQREPAIPESWLAWLTEIERADYAGKVETVRHIAICQPASDLQDPKIIRALADAMLRVSDGASWERLVHALPTLVQWLKDDTEYPRPVLRPVYDAILTLFMLLDTRGPPEREAIADFFDALLGIGPSIVDYRRILKDVGSFIDEGAGTETIYWLIDLAEVALRHPSRDEGARFILLNAILAAMSTTLSLLSPGQRAAYTRIAAVASWPPLPSVAVPQRIDFATYLAGKVVALYTLTESAARQARDTLLILAPSVRIELSHDHVCTPRLEKMAKQADLFVLASASAKHAATDCIQRHRQGAPLIYAAGRGFSSLIRAIEEYIENAIGSSI